MHYGEGSKGAGKNYRQRPTEGPLVRDAEASAAASADDRPTTLGRWGGQPSASFLDEAAGVAVHVAERRHRTAHHRWARDPTSPDYRIDGRTEILAASTQPEPPRAAEIFLKM